ncbi:hypothetical protein L209DRAFT_747730 [Thermothelomyces heterothallicus CBS 203.75]
MTAHVFLICLIFRSSLSPDFANEAGSKPIASPRFRGRESYEGSAATSVKKSPPFDARFQFAHGRYGRAAAASAVVDG